jgi:hypothetical protein
MKQDIKKINLNKVLRILQLSLFDTRDKIIMSNLFILCEFILILSKIADIILFSLVIQNNVYTINGTYVILFVVNYFIKIFFSQNNEFMSQYISTKYILDNSILLQNKLEENATVDYSVKIIPRFISSIPNIIKCLFWIFEIALVNVYLGFNQYYYEIIIADVGIIVVTSLTIVKYIYLIPYIRDLSKKKEELTLFRGVQFNKECENIYNSTKVVYFKNIQHSLLITLTTAFVFACIFILGLFENRIPSYLNFWKVMCFYLLTESLEGYVSKFIDDLPTFHKICDLYDTLF